ncbi:zinc finger protein 185 [Rhea pennata]|uniref:zinc finger protein 185 n=1 Tax=Rhea pennata TaxID=8795 RepID=UPI002E270111
MMSLGVSKGRVITPTDEDRRRIIRQMKVRTTLKGDKSWIHHQNSDSEEEKKSSPLSGQADGGSSVSAPIAPQSDRSSASKPQSGYLIRGVFTRTIDKTPSLPDSSSSKEAKKSTGAKGSSQCRSSSGYRMTTEDYKKLAPYNVKQRSVDLDEEDVPFTPDEHKKRTEAANSVLRRTASRERAYVLSAAKKSNGSPTQEFPPLFAKRIEIEEEEGQQRRNPTVSDSCKFTSDSKSFNALGKNTVVSSQNEPRTTANVSPCSTETSSKSQTATSLSETSQRISTHTEIRNGENRQASNENFSSETRSQYGDGDKHLKQKSELFSWDESASRATAVSTNGSYPENTDTTNAFYPPKSNSGCGDKIADATTKLHCQYEVSPYLDDAKSEAARSNVPSPLTDRTTVHPENTEYYFKRSAQGYEEETTPRERGHETTRAIDERKSELHPEGFSDSNNHTEKQEEPPDHDTHPESPRSKEHAEFEQRMAKSRTYPKDSTSRSTDVNKGSLPCVQSEEASSRRSSSLPRESSITAPESQWANKSDSCLERVTPAYEEQASTTRDSHHESLGAPICNEPNLMAARSNFSSKESTLSAYETQHPMPLYVDRQPYNTSVSAPSHRMPSYIASQVFSTQRPATDYQGTVYDGRSSPRSSRYDSASAKESCEFNCITSFPNHYPLSRDTTMSIPQRSHRVPFYMDSSDYNSTRLLSSSSERIATPTATLQYDSPAASGYGPDSSATGKGVLFVKEYMNSSELSSSPRYGSGSLVNLTDLERATSSHHSYLSSSPRQRSNEAVCSYCGREIRDCPKIIIEHLNICCHEYCFRCGICHKAMGDLLDKIFIHRDIVHCDKCYEKLF